MSLLNLGAKGSVHACEYAITNQSFDTLLHMVGSNLLLATGTIRRGLDGSSMLDLAVQYGNEECVSIVLDFYKKRNLLSQVIERTVNQKSYTPLFEACTRSCALNKMELLIRNGANMNIFDKSQTSLLIFLITRLLFERYFMNRTKLFKCLLQNGCDVNVLAKVPTNSTGTPFTGKYDRVELPVEVSLRAGVYYISHMLYETGSHQGKAAIWGKLGIIPWYNETSLNITEEDKFNTLSILNEVINQPRTLMKIVRMVIRKTLGEKVKCRIDLLPLPVAMKTFILIPELDYIIDNYETKLKTK
jgi:hypothetical protein